MAGSHHQAPGEYEEARPSRSTAASSRSIEVQHVKTKKSAVYRVKLKDLRAGHITERTFNTGEKLTAAERRDMQYLYGDTDALTFMNTQTFDQITVPRSIAGTRSTSSRRAMSSRRSRTARRRSASICPPR